MQLIDNVDQQYLKTNIPTFRPGDTIKVSYKITEGEKTRIQVFEGVVLRRNGGGVRETITVRKISYGVGVERIFPLHTPNIEKIEMVREGKVRRARLYYLRNLRGKKAQIKAKNLYMVKAEAKPATETQA